MRTRKIDLVILLVCMLLALAGLATMTLSGKENTGMAFMAISVLGALLILFIPSKK